jgi:hypothetical protein
MDTTGDITYREFLLNDEDILDSVAGGGGAGSGIEGCVVDTFDVSDVDVVQWVEKRSQADGSDTGDPELGVRRVRMSGTLYAKTRPALYDALFELRAALNPVLAQREEPLDHGYRPLYFSIPTARTDDFPSGRIDLQIKALPRAFQQTENRDAIGGFDDDALAVPWQASFVCRDPGIYSADSVSVDFTGMNVAKTNATGDASTNLITKASHGLVAGDRVTFYSLTGGTGLSTGVAYYVISSGLTTDDFRVSLTSGGSAVDFTTNITDGDFVESTTFSGTWDNRGNYLAKFNALCVVGSGAGTIVATVGDSLFTVTVPASNGDRTIRIKEDKVLSFEEDDVEVLQMSRIAFSNDTTWPLIDPGETPYSITFHGMAGLGAGGSMWFYESYA